MKLKTEGSERAVPLYPQLAAILEPYWDARRAEVGDDGLLFARWSEEKGTEVMIGNVTKAWHRLLAACEIRRRRIYDLRHTFASHALQLLRGGAPITELDSRLAARAHERAPGAEVLRPPPEVRPDAE